MGLPEVHFALNKVVNPTCDACSEECYDKISAIDTLGRRAARVKLPDVERSPSYRVLLNIHNGFVDYGVMYY